MATCSQCGETLTEGSWTCGKCGAAAPAAASPSARQQKESAEYDPQGYGDPDYAAPKLPPPSAGPQRGSGGAGSSAGMAIALWIGIAAILAIIAVWFFVLR